MADDWKSSIVEWLKDKLDLVTGGVWMVVWGVAMVLLLSIGRWDFAQESQKYLVLAVAIMFAGLSALFAKGIVSVCSKIWKSLETGRVSSDAWLNRQNAITAMTPHQRLLVACFVERGERELQLSILWALFQASLEQSDRSHAHLHFSSALHSLQDARYIDGPKFREPNYTYFETLDEVLFDTLAQQPSLVSAKSEPRTIFRKEAR